MVIWTTVSDDEAGEPPKVSLTGMLARSGDGTPGILRQTPFLWHDEAWEALVEVSRSSGPSVGFSAVIRLAPAVLARWRRRRLNPRMETFAQFCAALHVNGGRKDLGVVNLQAR
jgi:hypothetical protein